MKKKVVSLLLVAAMSATMIAGCGSGNGATEESTPAATGTETAESNADNAEAADTTDNSDKKIAMITDSGDITDESFNQITWETCVAYGDDNNVEYQ